MNRNQYSSERTVADVLADMKEELKEFVATRLTLLKTELREKAQTLKIAVPLAGVAILLLGTAYLLLTAAAVSLVAVFIPAGAYRWCLAFLAIGIAWGLLGALTAYFAKREFEMKEMLPRKTIAVLKQDRMWVQSEVKSQV
jgi:uncharacterized membrane protein YqjE